MTHEGFVSQSARIAPGVAVPAGAVVLDNVVIGAGVQIGYGAIIHPNVVIEDDCVIGDYAVIGKRPALGKASTVTAVEGGLPLLIGKNTIVGSHAVICCGTRIGAGCVVADFALVRERVEVGDGSVIGSQVVVENDVRIGRSAKIQSKAYVTAMSEVGDFAFIAPCVIMTNDNFMGRTQERFKVKGGPKVKRGARVGAGTILLPNVVVSEESFVATGSIVTRDTPEKKLVMGSPAKVLRDVPEKEWADNQ